MPYLYCGSYLGFGPLHLLADGSLGFAFGLEVPTVDTIPGGEEIVTQCLISQLHALPSDMQWQWFFSSDPGVEEALGAYATQPGHDSCGRMFAERFLQRWQRAQGVGFFPEDPGVNFFPRRQRILVAIKSAPLRLHRRSPSELISRCLPRGWSRGASAASSSDPPSETRRRAGAFVAAVRDILAATEASSWTARPLDAGGIIAWAELLLFPQRLPGIAAGTSDRDKGADPFEFEDIRTAIAALGQVDEVAANGFRTLAKGQERHHRVVSLLWQPRSVEAGMLNDLPRLRPHLTVSLSANSLSPTAALLQLKARALLNARSTHRFNATEMEARANALHEVEERIFAEGERIFEARLQIHVTEQSAAAADHSAAMICRHLESMEIESSVESDIGTALLLRACLPFAVYPETERKLRRRRRLLSRDFADLHPGGGCWTGVPPAPSHAASSRPSPIVMYSNPDGAPLFLDPTKAEKNPHALVIGQSGSGKSFFVHDYLLHLWRIPDVRLFLISIKADYRKLALLLGRYVEVSLDTDVSLNPFCGRPTLENQARWFAALVLMLNEGDPSANPLTRDAEVALQAAALAAAQRNWDPAADHPIRETILEDICQELERAVGPIGRQLASHLQPYRKGPYRRLFNAPRGIQASDRFIFFNLASILRQPCAALTSFCVFGMIDEVMADPELRGVPKGLIADEVWALVRNSQAAAILERSLKAYRSLGGFAMPIVQDPQDLDTPSGRVMLVNTATKIVLPMDQAGQADLQRYVRLNERELDIVRNLRLVKRRYSEFFVSIDGMKSAKGLLIPDPLRYAIATTDPSDEEQIERLFRQSGDMLDAVTRFAKECPFGTESPLPAAQAS
jgi:conjugal transfer ATP-binding protein TraC